MFGGSPPAFSNIMLYPKEIGNVGENRESNFSSQRPTFVHRRFGRDYIRAIDGKREHPIVGYIYRYDGRSRTYQHSVSIPWFTYRVLIASFSAVVFGAGIGAIIYHYVR